MADEKFDQAPPTNNRRDFLKTGAAALAGAAVLTELASAQSDAPKSRDSVPAFELDEITVVALQQGLASGRYTSRQLVEMHATRIEAIDQRGRSVLENCLTPPTLLEKAIFSQLRAYLLGGFFAPPSGIL